VTMDALDWWIDEEARDGPWNMAVDEWLLESVERPLLRVYGWEPGWGSLGYFVPLAEAERALPGLRWVRRRTGGGIVDHRADRTYTLVVPRGEALAEAAGGESYRRIHEALAAALGGGAGLAAGGAAAGGECFALPVAHDVVDPAGRKLAGAAQRRSRRGLVHQGSLLGEPGAATLEAFAGRLARRVERIAPEPPRRRIEALAAAYADPAWTARR